MENWNRERKHAGRELILGPRLIIIQHLIMQSELQSCQLNSLSLTQEMRNRFVLETWGLSSDFHLREIIRKKTHLCLFLMIIYHFSLFKRADPFQITFYSLAK